MRYDLQWTCTNEDMQTLELALDPQPADTIVAIVGGGEQVFSLAQHLDTGSVLGMDKNPFQIAQGYLKQALLSFNCEEYVSFLNGKRRNQLWEKLQHTIPTQYMIYGKRVCAFRSGEIDQRLMLRDIYERIPWLADDAHFARVAQHAQKVSFHERYITEALHDLPSESVDKIYLSNVIVTDISCDKELCRVLRSGGRLYGLFLGSLYLPVVHKKLKRMCALEKKVARTSHGLEYSFSSMFSLFIGIKE